MNRKHKSEPGPRNYLFIVNPKSGRRTSKRLIREIRRRLDLHPEIHYEIALTREPGHATELAATYAARHGDDALVFACGGDGTANEVVNGLAGTSATLGILPIGTSNDFCHAALSTLRLSDLLDRLTEPQIRPIDLIAFGDRICLNILSLGLDTLIQIKATRMNRYLHLPGKAIYPLAIIVGLFGQRVFSMQYNLTIYNDQGEKTDIKADSSFVLAAVCNGRYYGGGYNPSPQARIDDGLLDVCLVSSMPLRKIIPLIPLYKKGRHLDSPAVKFYSAVSGTLTSTAASLPGNADGEVFSLEEIHFQVLPGHLKFAAY